MYVNITVSIFFCLLTLITVFAMSGIWNTIVAYVTSGEIDKSITCIFDTKASKYLFPVARDWCIDEDATDLLAVIIINWVLLGALVALLWPAAIVSLFVYGILRFARSAYTMKSTVNKLTKESK